MALEASAKSSFERAFARLADGDRSAAGEVFAVLWPKLRRFCERAVGTDGEDCAQRAIMTLFEEISSFDAHRSPLAWAYAIAAWECRSQRRRLGRSRELGREDEESPGSDPEPALEDRDLVRRALEVVSSLSELDRETLLADVMNEAPTSPTQRQRRHRMLERLRAAWRTLHGS